MAQGGTGWHGVARLSQGWGLGVGGSDGLRPGEAGGPGAGYPASDGNKTLPTTNASFLSESLLTH